MLSLVMVIFVNDKQKDRQKQIDMIGIIGGTFDPIHFGHLRPALEIMELLSLEELRFIPSAKPPHRWQPEAGAQHRLKMTDLAIKDVKGFVIDDREYQREGASYTVDTLKSIRKEISNERPLCMIIGLDAFQSFTQWHDWKTILTLTHIIVSPRPGYEITDADAWAEPYLTQDIAELKQKVSGKIYFAEVTQFEIAATDIREKLHNRKNITYLLPKTVSDYIDKQQLYIKS